MIWGVSQPAGKWAALQLGGRFKFPNCRIKCQNFLVVGARQSPWHHNTDVPSHLALTDFSLQFDVTLYIWSSHRTAQDAWSLWIPSLKQCVVSLFKMAWAQSLGKNSKMSVTCWLQYTDLGIENSLDRRGDHWVLKIGVYTFILRLKDY